MMLVRKKYLYDDIMQTLINTQNIKKRKLKNCIFEKKNITRVTTGLYLCNIIFLKIK